MHRQSQTLIVPEREASVRFAALFDGTRIEIRVTAAYLTEAWRKLGINVMANGVTALTGRPLGVFHRPDIELLGRRLLLESWAVAAADGAELTAADVDAFFAGFGQVDPEGPTSMLQDRRAGRPTEHDAVCTARSCGPGHASASPRRWRRRWARSSPLSTRDDRGSDSAILVVMATESRMVSLGFGKFARADKIYALEPLRGPDRGDGKRTKVWVEGLTEPIIASRTERTILQDMGQGAAADAPILTEALDLAARLATAAEAGRVDLGDLGRRARHLLAATTAPDDGD